MVVAYTLMIAMQGVKSHRDYVLKAVPTGMFVGYERKRAIEDNIEGFVMTTR